MKKCLCAALLAVLCALGGAAGEAPIRARPLPAAPRRSVEAGATQAPAVFSEADAPYDGAWQPFEDGFRLYLPRSWSSVALTGKQREAGLFYRADGDDGAMAIAVGYMSAGGLSTVEDLAGDFELTGYLSVTRVDLNGIPAIGFERPQDDYRGVAFFHPIYPEYVMLVYVSPLSPRDEESRRIGQALLASIGPLPDFPGQVKK